MDFEILKGLNIAPVPIIIICFVVIGLRQMVVDRLFDFFRTPEMFKNNIIFFLPLVISFGVTFLFTYQEEYLKQVLINWCFSGFLYKFVKNFVPSQEIKEPKKPRGIV